MALNICHDVIVDSERGRELAQHGSALFPIACYAEDLSSYSVAWHWHEEFEYVLCMKGPLHVDVNKTRLTLQTGQGVFINSGPSTRWNRHRRARLCSTQECSTRGSRGAWIPSSGRSSSAP